MSSELPEKESQSFALPMPKTMLQSLYHAVTGKTENLSKRINGNVIVNFSDFEQLYLRVRQQAEHYDILSTPTVTVVVKQEDRKTTQYSSWERFKTFQQNSSDITSEVSLKIEFIVNLPNTVGPQRFVINVSIDSGLPVIHGQMKGGEESEFAGFYIFIARDFPTVEISIDFVDFLIAKIFVGVVEGWFSNLQKVKNSRTVEFVAKKLPIFNAAINQISRLGMAMFAFTYAIISRNFSPTVSSIASALGIAIVLWCVMTVVTSFTTSLVTRKISRALLPSMLIMTDGDQRAYDTIKENRTSLRHAAFNVAAASLLSLILNVVASYIYAAMTSP